MRSRFSNLGIVLSLLLISGIVLIPEEEEGSPANRVIDPETTFSIAVFPDTQIYPLYYPGTFINMTEWVVEHRDEYNIRFVLHEGDITNNNNHPQWYNASKAMHILNGSVPYTLNPGNHDLGPNGNTANRDTYLNDHFPSGPIENWTSWGGAFEEGHQENTYYFFSAGGRDWMVLALEFAPRDAVLEWANDVVETHPDRLVLLVTHNYMVADMRMTTLGGDYGVESSPEGAATGEDIWQELVRLHRNIMCVFSGHVLYEWGWLVSRGVNGNPVYQMMANFQMNAGGGEGFFRLLTFNMETETVYVETYSPLLDQVKEAAEHRFSFGFNTFDHVNDRPVILNPLEVFSMFEDQEAGYLDLDGNLRQDTGLFFDRNIPGGDELKFDVWKEDGWTWVGPGVSLKLGDIGITMMENRTFMIEVAENWFGTLDLKIRARDKREGEVNTTIRLEVIPVNDPPFILPPDMWTYYDPRPDIRGDIITCPEDRELHFWVKGEDVVEPGDKLTYHMFTDEIELFTLENDTGEFGFFPLNEHVGSHLITYGVDDGSEMNTREVLIKVSNTNDAPRIITETMNGSLENERYTFRFTAVDEDPTADVLTWSMITDASFLEMDRRTGIVTGTPGDEDVGCYDLIVTVNDGNGGEDIRDYVLEVLNVNDPPHVSGSPWTLFMDEDTVVYFNLSGWFADIDNDVIRYEILVEKIIEAEVMDNDTIRIEPSLNWAGSTRIQVTASDGNESVSDELGVVVENINDPPTDPGYRIDQGSPTENGRMFKMEGWAVDPDTGDEHYVEWFSNITGKLGSGNGSEILLIPGHHLITMKVTDSAGEWVQVNFELVVTPVNDMGDDDEHDLEGSSSPLLFVIMMTVIILVSAAIIVLIVSVQRRRKHDDASLPDEDPSFGKDPPAG
ncbi:MAG: tandem-95 repeat protein [Candidatus Thermoplasmatota archaeon]|nr:tandem-95 repeat protein [Candidatus Thermoplasmatota archaeon]